MHRTPQATAPSCRTDPPRPSVGAMEVIFTALGGLHPGVLSIEALIDRIEGRP